MIVRFRWLRWGGSIGILCGLLALGGVAPASGQALLLEGGPPRLQIDRFEAGASTASATDESTTLLYTRPRNADGPYAISVTASAPDQQFDLHVEAPDATHGTPAGRVALREGQAPTALLRDIEPCPESAADAACEEEATLRYRMTAAVDDGPGADRYVVRFTIRAQ